LEAKRDLKKDVKENFRLWREQGAPFETLVTKLQKSAQEERRNDSQEKAQQTLKETSRWEEFFKNSAIEEREASTKDHTEGRVKKRDAGECSCEQKIKCLTKKGSP